MTGPTTRDSCENCIAPLDAHEFDRTDEFVHESIVLRSEPSSRAAVVAQLRSTVDAVPDLHRETQELAVDGDALATRLISIGAPATEWLGAAPTGRSIGIVEHAIHRIRDGKFLHTSAVHDAAALQEQLAG